MPESTINSSAAPPLAGNSLVSPEELKLWLAREYETVPSRKSQ